MTTSEQGRQMIEGFENFEAHAYKPTPVDVWTIGYGHTKNVHEGDTCTRGQADAWLSEDLSEAEAPVNDLVKVTLAQHEFDALASFVMNEGYGHFKQSTLLTLLNQDERLGAANQFLRWIYQNGKVLNGLVDRRALERRVFLQGYEGAG